MPLPMHEQYLIQECSLPKEEQNGYLDIFFHLYTFQQFFLRVQVTPIILDYWDSLQEFKKQVQINILPNYEYKNMFHAIQYPLYLIKSQTSHCHCSYWILHKLSMLQIIIQVYLSSFHLQDLHELSKVGFYLLLIILKTSFFLYQFLSILQFFYNTFTLFIKKEWQQSYNIKKYNTLYITKQKQFNKMIRQKKQRALIKNAFKIQSFVPLSQDIQNLQLTKCINPQKKQQLLEEGIFSNLFNININQRKPICFTVKGRKQQTLKQKKVLLCVEGINNSKHIDDKQNILEDSFHQGHQHQKRILLQTTGNPMLSFKNFKRKQMKQKQKRPLSAVNSNRGSFYFHSDYLDGSLSKALEQLNQNNSNVHKDKISTSRALVMFSKVIRNSQNSSRELFQKKIKSSESERYKSVSVLANKVKIKSKQLKQKHKIDFRSYLKKFKLLGDNKQEKNIGKGQKNEQQFQLEGWQTRSISRI